MVIGSKLALLTTVAVPIMLNSAFCVLRQHANSPQDLANMGECEYDSVHPPPPPPSLPTHTHKRTHTRTHCHHHPTPTQAAARLRLCAAVRAYRKPLLQPNVPSRADLCLAMQMLLFCLLGVRRAWPGFRAARADRHARAGTDVAALPGV